MWLGFSKVMGAVGMFKGDGCGGGFQRRWVWLGVIDLTWNLRPGLTLGRRLEIAADLC